MVAKQDPIRDKFFRPLETAENASGFLFILTAVASLFIPILNPATQAGVYAFAQIIFAILVLCFFVSETSIRLYFGPRSQRKRFEDFLAHAHGVQLSTAQTSGYYNSKAPDVTKRMAAQLLENSLYSEDTATRMVRNERIKIALYFLLWIFLVLNRSSDLALIALVVQIIFSEQIVSRWLRLEWLRSEFEKVHDEMFRLMVNNLPLEVPTMEMLGRYEIAKASAGITLSAKIFKSRQPITDAKWARVRKKLKI